MNLMHTPTSLLYLVDEKTQRYRQEAEHWQLVSPYSLRARLADWCYHLAERLDPIPPTPRPAPAKSVRHRLSW